MLLWPYFTCDKVNFSGFQIWLWGMSSIGCHSGLTVLIEICNSLFKWQFVSISISSSVIGFLPKFPSLSVSICKENKVHSFLKCKQACQNMLYYGMLYHKILSAEISCFEKISCFEMLYRDINVLVHGSFIWLYNERMNIHRHIHLRIFRVCLHWMIVLAKTKIFFDVCRLHFHLF